MNSVDILWVERHRWVPPMRGTSSTMWSSGCWSCRSCGMYSKTWRKSWTGRNGLWNWPLFPLAPPGTLSICLWCSLGGVSGRLISNFGSPFGECSSIFVLSVTRTANSTLIGWSFRFGDASRLKVLLTLTEVGDTLLTTRIVPSLLLFLSGGYVEPTPVHVVDEVSHAATDR